MAEPIRAMRRSAVLRALFLLAALSIAHVAAFDVVPDSYSSAAPLKCGQGPTFPASYVRYIKPFQDALNDYNSRVAETTRQAAQQIVTFLLGPSFPKLVTRVTPTCDTGVNGLALAMMMKPKNSSVTQALTAMVSSQAELAELILTDTVADVFGGSTPALPGVAKTAYQKSASRTCPLDVTGHSGYGKTARPSLNI